MMPQAEPRRGLRNTCPPRAGVERGTISAGHRTSGPASNDKLGEDESRPTTVCRMRGPGAGHRGTSPPLHRRVARLLGSLRRGDGVGVRRLPLRAGPPAHRGRLRRPSAGSEPRRARRAGPEVARPACLRRRAYRPPRPGGEESGRAQAARGRGRCGRRGLPTTTRFAGGPKRSLASEQPSYRKAELREAPFTLERDDPDRGRTRRYRTRLSNSVGVKREQESLPTLLSAKRCPPNYAGKGEVDPRGLEPLASAMRGRRSPN
jgi:hypothetical protein